MRMRITLVAFVAVFLSGCTVTRAITKPYTGSSPWAGRFVSASGVGAEQVKFTFQFKAGPDPLPAQTPADSPAIADNSPAPVAGTFRPISPLAVRIGETRLTDTTGRTLGVVDQDLRNDANVYTVTVVSSAASPDSYEIICQTRLMVAGYHLRICGSAYREVDGWRAEPRSFRFAIYNGDQTAPWWEKNYIDLR